MAYVSYQVSGYVFHAPEKICALTYMCGRASDFVKKAFFGCCLEVHFLQNGALGIFMTSDSKSAPSNLVIKVYEISGIIQT